MSHETFGAAAFLLPAEPSDHRVRQHRHQVSDGVQVWAEVKCVSVRGSGRGWGGVGCGGALGVVEVRRETGGDSELNQKMYEATKRGIVSVMKPGRRGKQRTTTKEDGTKLCFCSFSSYFPPFFLI